MDEFWKDLYPTFATVLSWQQRFDEVVPPWFTSPVTPNDSPFVDEEDQLTGWQYTSWNEKNEAIAEYEASGT